MNMSMSLWNIAGEINNVEKALEKDDTMKREKIACNCKNITYGMIEDAIKNGASSYEEVEQILKFGTGCGKCKEFIHYLVRDYLEEQEK